MYYASVSERTIKFRVQKKVRQIIYDPAVLVLDKYAGDEGQQLEAAVASLLLDEGLPIRDRWDRGTV